LFVYPENDNDNPMKLSSTSTCTPTATVAYPPMLPPADAEEELAILFLDIRNFTGLMESRPAREVIEVVHRLFSMFNKIIKTFSGTVIEMAGDSLYAVFGFGTTIKEAANQGYQAARMMFESVRLFNDAYATEYGENPLEIAIGLHTGRVVVGHFGLESQQQQLSVMGLPVNIASRLQAKTKELNNDLIVSEETYGLLQDNTSNGEKRTVSLPGLSSNRQVRLLGKPYYRNIPLEEPDCDLDYVLAISG